MAESVIQSSFAAGEISPNLFARVDLDKYHVGAELMRNFFVDYRGGASTRTGTELIERTRYTDTKARLIPFVFSQDQSYILEFGDLYIRFFVNGAAVLEAPKAILGITQANPGIVNVAAHGYATNDDIYLSNIVGMFELNGRTPRIVVIDANHFSLWDWDGIPIDTSGYNAYISGGTSQRVYTVTSPYVEADLPLLKFVQSADVMTITHNAHPAMDLSRLGPSSFTLTAVTIGPALPATGAINSTPTTAGNLRYGYVVVALTEGGEKGSVSATTTCDSVPLDQTAASPKNIVVDWNPVTGADRYNIYKWGPILNTAAEPTVFGYIGTTTDIQFTDNNIGPDFSSGPPEFRDPFASNNPGCVTYFQQRRGFAGLTNSPQELDLSQVGAYSNFDVAFTVNDSDAIQIAIAARQVNEIKSLVPMASGLVVLTSGGAFQITGGSAQVAVTPTNITALPQASTGANDLPPIVVNYDILFVQNKGSIVRDLAYNFYLQTFYGFDRSALANHLFFGKRLIEWAYAEEPFKIIWATRSDGKLLSLTYVPEQEVYGWARHDTQGAFESVASVPEGQEDAVYFIVQRTYNGDNRVRYIERLATRKFIRVEDVWCVDSAINLHLDRPAFDLDMSANAVTAFIQSSTPAFDATWINKIFWFDVGGKLRVNSISTPSQIICDILEPLGNAIPNTEPVRYFRVERGDWEVGPLVTQISGGDHLKGQPVIGLTDGSVLGPVVMPANGILELPEPASKVLIGLGFQAQLQTLKLDVGDPTIQGKRKKIAAVTVFVDQSRGLKAGGTFDTLRNIKEQPASAFTPPLGLFSTEERLVINGSWNVDGIVCIQQDFPFPSTVLGVVPEVVIGDTQR